MKDHGQKMTFILDCDSPSTPAQRSILDRSR